MLLDELNEAGLMPCLIVYYDENMGGSEANIK